MISVLCTSLITLPGCTPTEDSSLTSPLDGEIVPPLVVTIDQLYAEYMADEVAADAKYKWKRLAFYEVVVEEVFGSISYFDFGYEAFRKTHFMSGSVIFTDLLDFEVAMQNIEVGFVLNIVGECRGLKDGSVSISDSWVESVKGDLGTVEQEAPQY
jgi:hypothetical protein